MSDKIVNVWLQYYVIFDSVVIQDVENSSGGDGQFIKEISVETL